MLTVNINLLWTVINVLILLVVVKLALIKPVKKVLEERQAMVDRSIAEADEARQSALRLEQEHADRLKDVEAEKSRTLSEAAEKAGADYDRIVNEAKVKAMNIVATAENDARSRKQEIMMESRGELTQLVMDAAEKVVSGKADADAALYDLFLEKVGSANDQ